MKLKNSSPHLNNWGVPTILTDSSKVDVTAALVTPTVLMLARTGAPKPIEESCLLVGVTYNVKIPIRKKKKEKRKKGNKQEKKNWKSRYRSEIVLSRSTNAPPHIKRISFVSICRSFINS